MINFLKADVKVQLDDSKLKAGLDRSKGLVTRTTSAMGKAFKKIGSGFASIYRGVEKTASGIAKAFKFTSDHVIATTAAVTVLQKKLDVTTSRLSKIKNSLKKVAIRFGLVSAGATNAGSRLAKVGGTTGKLFGLFSKLLSVMSAVTIGFWAIKRVVHKVIAAYKLMYKVGRIAFKMLWSIAKWFVKRFIRRMKWMAAITVATFVGMYYKATKAAMAFEEMVTPRGILTTASALKKLRRTWDAVLAAMGRPFLPRLKSTMLLITNLLEKNKSTIGKWAEKVARELDKVELAFRDWVAYMQVDPHKGIKIALETIYILFVSFAKSAADIMWTGGKLVASAFWSAFVTEMKELGTKVTIWLSNYLLEMIAQKFTGLPVKSIYDTIFGDYLQQKDEKNVAEGLFERIVQRYEDMVNKVKALHEGLPTFGQADLGDRDQFTAGWITASSEATARMLKDLDTEYDMLGKTTEQRKAALDLMKYQVEVEKLLVKLHIGSVEKILVYFTLLGEFRKKLERNLALVKEIEDAKVSEKAAENYDKMRSALQFEYDILGKTNDERERAETLAQVQVETNNMLNLSADERNQKLEDYMSLLDQLQEKQASFMYNIQLWMNKTAEVGKNLANIVTNAFDTMADNLAGALMGMEQDWKAFGRAVIKEILAYIIKLQLLSMWQQITRFGGGTQGETTGGYATTMGYTTVQHGGEVEKTGWAKIHKGEVFSGVNNEMGFGGVTIKFNNTGLTEENTDIEPMTEDRVISITKRASIQFASTDGAYMRSHGLGG